MFSSSLKAFPADKGLKPRFRHDIQVHRSLKAFPADKGLRGHHAALVLWVIRLRHFLPIMGEP